VASGGQCNVIAASRLGFFGGGVVLMEEDHVTDSGAEAGHQAPERARHALLPTVRSDYLMLGFVGSIVGALVYASYLVPSLAPLIAAVSLPCAVIACPSR
jgi:hypothetical protein